MQKKYTQRELAEAAGVTSPYISRLRREGRFTVNPLEVVGNSYVYGEDALAALLSIIAASEKRQRLRK